MDKLHNDLTHIVKPLLALLWIEPLYKLPMCRSKTMLTCASKQYRNRDHKSTRPVEAHRPQMQGLYLPPQPKILPLEMEKKAR